MNAGGAGQNRASFNQGLFQRLRQLRNAIAHGVEQPDEEALAQQLQGLGIPVPPDDLQWFVADLLRGLSSGGEHFVPPTLLGVVRGLLEGTRAKLAVDPWAGVGVLAAVVQEASQAAHTIAHGTSPGTLALAKALTPQLDWRLARITDPLAFLGDLPGSIDIAACIPPMGMKAPVPIEIASPGGPTVKTRDVGQALLVACGLKLSPDGRAMFVLPAGVFFSTESIVRQLPLLGLGIEAALELPAGSFAPYANVSAYLLVVRKQPLEQMFVAQLSQDANTNRQIVANLREGKADGALELGRFVAAEDFRGLEPLRLDEQLRRAERRFQAPAVRLGDLAQAIQLGRPGDDFVFSTAGNALYIPLIGISDVVDSTEALTLKKQNYAQVVVDETRSDARFVARFLNTELGRSIREAYKSGSTILKLNTTGLKELRVFVPNLATQRKTLEIEARLEAEQNTIRGLQNDLAAIRRELWANPEGMAEVDSRLRAFSVQLAAGATPQVATTLDQWFETLPFPLASILRAWQATPSQDYKTQCEHLLHFFEAAVEFFSIIYLSAFTSRAELWAVHKKKLREVWKKQHLSLERATFGTWKVVVEYLSKQTRELLFADPEKRALCAELFGDPTQVLPAMLARKELAAVFSAANKMRNDWAGHGGVVGQEEARLRNEQLLAELQKLREVMEDGWRQVELVRCLQCRAHPGMFDNDVAVLVGSNSEFLKVTRQMSSFLYVERLYLASRDSGRALLLLPLIQVGPSPTSAKNACYFFNRVEKDGARFISYHFEDQPERTDKSDDMATAILLFSEDSAGNDH